MDPTIEGTADQLPRGVMAVLSLDSTFQQLTMVDNMHVASASVEEEPVEEEEDPFLPPFANKENKALNALIRVSTSSGSDHHLNIGVHRL